jgi:hypothetical protein
MTLSCTAAFAEASRVLESSETKAIIVPEVLLCRDKNSEDGTFPLSPRSAFIIKASANRMETG